MRLHGQHDRNLIRALARREYPDIEIGHKAEITERAGEGFWVEAHVLVPLEIDMTDEQLAGSIEIQFGPRPL